jgi:hypothetical protein
MHGATWDLINSKTFYPAPCFSRLFFGRFKKKEGALNHLNMKNHRVEMGMETRKGRFLIFRKPLVRKMHFRVAEPDKPFYPGGHYETEL